MITDFTVNNYASGERAQLSDTGKCNISFKADWTFPLNFAEIISGDGKQVYRQKISLDDTKTFGVQSFHVPADMKNRKWVRLEVWDVAANGAFTQTIWLK